MISYFIRHKTASNLLMILILFLGFKGINNLKRATFPDAKLGEVEVIVSYPGASPKKVETSLCTKLEDSVEGLPGIDEIQCHAQAGLARLVVKSEEGSNFERLLQDVQREIEALDTLPQSSSKPVVQHSNRLDPVISVVLTSKMPVQDLYQLTRILKDQIYQKTDIAKVNITGFSQPQIQIRVEESVLEHYNLSLVQIANTIAAQNRDIPLGVLHSRGQELRLSIEEEKTRVEDLEDLIIVSRANGFELKLGDFARIEYDFEFEEDQVEFHSQRAAIMNLMMNPTDDVLNLTEQIKDFITRQSQRYNHKVDFHFTKDNAGIVKDRLNMLVSNAIQGLLLVSVVLYLFFGLKFSFWVVLGLPVSFAGAFYLMTPLGQSINMMSMVGLLLAIGILMDDAVVISENIASHFQKGKSPVQAAIDGTKEVFASVLSSFLTTVAMFSGLIFMSGDIGRILKAIPIVLILVLAVSLLEAFLILPHHVKESLGHFTGEGGIRHRFLNWFEKLRLNHFEPLVRFCLKTRYLTVSLMMLLLFISVSMITGGKLKFSALPDLEGNTIVSRVAMPPGTPLQTTKEVCNTILVKFQELDKEYKEKYQDSLIRGIYTRYSHNVDYQESGPHVATVTVDLISPQERKMSLVQILSRWEELVGQIAGASSISYQEPVLGPSGRPLHLRLFHSDLRVLSSSSQALKQKLSGYKGVHNVMTDLRPGQPQVQIALQNGIMATGLSNQNLGEQLSSAIQGRKIQDVTLNSDVTEIVVTASRENQGRLDFVDHFNLKLQDGKRIPMEQAGTIATSRDWSRISRSNGRRMVNVTAEIDSEFANAAEITQNLMTEFLPAVQEKNPGLQVAIEGEVKNARQTGNSIQSAFVTGLVGLFIILSYQFGCYLQPLLILMTIPLSLIGVIWGHLILGFDLSLPSLMGFVALTGVMVNNAIMLVHFVELHKEDGLELSQCAIEASLARFRPIIITTSTTLVGMLPLLFERSLQAQILQPLVISLCFGLASATVLVLIFLPCLYGIMEDMRQ